MAAMVDGQMQCVSTGTILGIRIVEGVVSGGVVLSSVPCVIIACRIGIGKVAAMVDGQVQGVGAGCALVIGIGIGIPAGRGVGDSVPNV